MFLQQVVLCGQDTVTTGQHGLFDVLIY